VLGFGQAILSTTIGRGVFLLHRFFYPAVGKKVLSDAVKNNINLLRVSSVKGKVSVFSAILLLQISTVQVDIDVNIWFGCIFVQMLRHFAGKD
jgi:hypothetical protein